MKEFKINNNKKNGFTLIELIVSIAILGIVIVLVTTLYNFGSTTYKNGINQSNIQNEIRLASSMVTNELRYATEVKLLSTVNSNWYTSPINSVGTYDNYIFVYNDHLVIQSRYHRTEYNIGQSGTLSFDGTNSDILDIIISTQEEGQTYSLKSEIEPLNLDLVNGIIDVTESSLSGVLLYRTTNNYYALKALPVATIGSNISPTEITVSYSKTISTVNLVNDLTSPNNPALYSLSMPTTNQIKLNVVGGATAGTQVTFTVTLDKYDDGNFVEFYYTLFFDGSTWTLI